MQWVCKKFAVHVWSGCDRETSEFELECSGCAGSLQYMYGGVGVAGRLVSLS